MIETVLLYGSTTWTLTQSLDKTLDGAYTKMLRVVKNVTWQQRITNEVLCAGLPRILTTIRGRLLKFSGHCGGVKMKSLANCFCGNWSMTKGVSADRLAHLLICWRQTLGSPETAYWQKIATGKYSTNFKAEAEALKKAAIEIRNNLPQTKPNVVIFTDALSVLSKLQNPHQWGGNCPGWPRSPDKPNLAVDSSTLRDPGKWASRPACQGGRPARTRGQIYHLYWWKDHHQNSLSKKKWKQQHPNYNQSDSLHKLNRTEQVVLFRLRTGHNRLNAHMYNKFKVGESEMYPCNTDIMTAEHLLQHCWLHDAMRRDTWLAPRLLRDKLYGNLGELRRTAAFMRATGISI